MKALYRKYRPKSLDEVVAEPQVVTPLKNAIKSGKINHSYLFTGPRGCGKTSVARILAHEINKFPYSLEDSYLDIIEIDAASNTGVDNIRDLREKALVAPSEGKYKVYIIDEVHMLSKSAFNALLKTLEEPPEHVVFILATTDLEKVPVTITSRSQVFTFRLAFEEEMLPHLKTICEKEKINIEEDALKLLISRGGGSFRDTLSLLDQISSLSSNSEPISEVLVASVLGLPLDKKLSDLLSAYSSGDFVAVSAQLKSLLSEGLKPESIAESILKKIIARPSPEFLPLLGSLPSVSAPFPEAKLLLALLKDCKPTQSFPLKNASERGDRSSQDVRRSRPIPQGIERKSVTSYGFTEMTQRSQRSDWMEADTRDGGLAELRSSKGTRSESPEEQKSPKNLLDSLKATNPALFEQLSRCELHFSENSLKIYPLKKITKIILEKPQNIGILRDNLPEGFEISILDISELASKDPKLSKISDIMGGAQPLSASDSPF
ncbi:DNA polymerase III subunit gamma/tau [Candidatus Saccharibacteria bacterium]|nr:DNA polymerase III subunit gamma/tau [Candidatus Saccharibacteria bacterium]